MTRIAKLGHTDLRIAVVILFALVATPAAEAGLAFALAGVHVARLGRRTNGIAVAGLATLPTGNLPVIFYTSIDKK